MVLVWFGFAFLAVGALFLWLVMRSAGQAKASLRWPSAIGRVLHTEVRVIEREVSSGGENESTSTTTWYLPIVQYEYQAGGQTLKGSRIAFGNPHRSSPKGAEAAIAPYTAGSSVPVYYNPAKPSEAVLERSAKAGSAAYKIIGIVFALVGFACVLIGVLQRS